MDQQSPALRKSPLPDKADPEWRVRELDDPTVSGVCGETNPIVAEDELFHA